MSEGDVKVKAKRSRSKPKGNKAGSQWVCEATQEACKRAIIVKFPDGTTHAFISVPVAARVISTTFSGDDREAMLKQLADDTEQSVLNVPIAKDFSLLVANGGLQTYAAWSSDLRDWDVITDKHGYTVREWDAAVGKKTPGAKKGKSKPQKIAFDAGTYLIKQRGAPERLKGVEIKVVPVDGNSDTAKTVESDDILGAHRKIRAFAGDHKIFFPASLFHEHFTAIYCTPSGVDVLITKQEDIDAKSNKLASKLLERPVSGPAIVTFFRKTSVKLDE